MKRGFNMTVKTKKDEVLEKVKELYVFNSEMDESSVKKERKRLYKDALSLFETWEKALKACGITKRKIREREKFILYFILKERYKKYGVEAMRPKNVQPEEIKERIVNSFKTLKALKDTITNWNEDKVMYELHSAFLTGTSLDEIEEKNPDLFENMMDHYKDVKHALNEYDKRFGLPTIDGKEIKIVTSENKDLNMAVSNSYDNDELINMMIKLKYIENEEDAKAILEAKNIEKQEIVSFVFRVLGNAQINGEKITEDSIKKENPAIYFAMRATYGSLENALREATNSLVFATSNQA